MFFYPMRISFFSVKRCPYCAPNSSTEATWKPLAFWKVKYTHQVNKTTIMNVMKHRKFGYTFSVMDGSAEKIRLPFEIVKFKYGRKYLDALNTSSPVSLNSFGLEELFL